MLSISYVLHIENKFLTLYSASDKDLIDVPRHIVHVLDLEEVNAAKSYAKKLDSLSDSWVWNFDTTSPSIELRDVEHKVSQVFKSKLDNKTFIFPITLLNKSLVSYNFTNTFFSEPTTMCNDEDSPNKNPKGTVIGTLENHKTGKTFINTIPIFFFPDTETGNIDNDNTLTIIPGYKENGHCTIFSSLRHNLKDFIPFDYKTRNIQVIF